MDPISKLQKCHLSSSLVTLLFIFLFPTPFFFKWHKTLFQQPLVPSFLIRIKLSKKESVSFSFLKSLGQLQGGHVTNTGGRVGGNVNGVVGVVVVAKRKEMAITITLSS